MKILVITDQFPPFHSGGYELRIKNIIDYLFKVGNEILVLSNSVDQMKIKSTAINNKYPVNRILNKKYRNNALWYKIIADYKEIKKIYKVIDNFAPEIIHISHLGALSKAILPFLIDQDIPLVFDDGGDLTNCIKKHLIRRIYFFENHRDNKYKIIAKEIILRLIYLISGNYLNTKKIDLIGRINIYYNNSFSYNQSIGFINSVLGNGRLLSSGVDLEKFQLGIKKENPDCIKILCPGRVSPVKNQLNSIELFNYLIKQNICTELIIVGSFEDQKYLKQLELARKQSKLPDSIKIIGKVDQDELVTLYRWADICFFTSKQKFGFSRIPIEAMACGTLVVSFGFEGSDAVVETNKTGFLVGNDFLSEIYHIIDNVIMRNNQIYHKIVTAAHKKIMENFSLDDYLLKVESFIKEIQVGSNVHDRTIS